MEDLDLFEQMLLSKGIKLKEQKIEKNRREADSYNLSFAQKRMWFMQMFDPDSYSYNITTSIKIEGNLDVRLLEICFNEVIKRHEILRTYFVDINDEPKQVIEDSLQFKIEEIDLCLSKDQNLEQQIINISQKVFNLSELPLFRIVLLKVSENSYIFVLVMHHIIGDGWSTSILVKEIAHLYNIKREERSDSLPELKYQYADFAEWQHRFKQAGKLDDQLLYWKKKLELCNKVLELPTDRSRPAIQSGKGSLLKFELTKELSNSLKDISKSEGITNSILFLSCFYILLNKYTKQSDVLIGMPIAGRDDSDFEDLIGLFVNTIIMRINSLEQYTFKDHIKEVKSIAVEAYSNQNVPLELIIDKINPLRTTANTPLFQSMFSYENIADRKVSISGLNVTSLKMDVGFSQVDISLSMKEKNGLFEGSFDYNTDIFDKWRIENMIVHFKNVLDSIVKSPEIKLIDIPLIADNEKLKIIDTWNSNSAPIAQDNLLHELFENQVIKTPDKIALNYKNLNITYKELDVLSNKLAKTLFETGIRSNEIVAIYLEQSIELLISILSVLKLGAAYLPLDPAYPKNRINTILSDAGVEYAITNHSSPGSIEQVTNIDVNLFLDSSKSCTIENIESSKSLQDIACVIYTSGTSGKPKGVLIEHGNIVNLVKSFNESYNSNEDDIILPVTSIASSSFVGEIFPLLCCGGGLVLNNNMELLDIDYLQTLITKKQISILSTVPSILEKINNSSINIPSLRLILCGGEELTINQISELIKTKTIVNGYGITETTICSTYECIEFTGVDENVLINIGKPTINTKIYVLDNDSNILPVGYPGEIYISGMGVTRGYVNNPELTDLSFINSPFNAEERVFKTGDLASWLPNGKLKYHGRVDNQVQIRGYRIELGEIESHLKKHSLINNAAVIKKGDMAGGDQLVAFIVCDETKTSDFEIRNFLRGSIPDYMIPSYYEYLKEIPYNVNGKVNLDLLLCSQISSNKKVQSFGTQKSETEKMIAVIWERHLKVENISLFDNFFDIGGHSLLVVEIFNDLKNVVEKELTIVDLFNFPTIKGLATFLNNSTEGEIDINRINTRAEKRNRALELRKQKINLRNRSK